MRERQASPKDDGVSRILAARGGDGLGIGVEEAKRELHHIVVAGLIEWAWFLTGVRLQMISMEIRRLSPVVHVFFGQAKETFTFKGFRVPKGWMVPWGHRTSHVAPEVYARPEEFDPSRFAPPREEHKKHEHAFVPNGAGPPEGHKCAGWEFAPLFLQVFLVELSRDYDVTLSRPQDYD